MLTNPRQIILPSFLDFSEVWGVGVHGKRLSVAPIEMQWWPSPRNPNLCQVHRFQTIPGSCLHPQTFHPNWHAGSTCKKLWRGRKKQTSSMLPHLNIEVLESPKRFFLVRAALNPPKLPQLLEHLKNQQTNFTALKLLLWDAFCRAASSRMHHFSLPLPPKKKHTHFSGYHYCIALFFWLSIRLPPRATSQKSLVYIYKDIYIYIYT